MINTDEIQAAVARDRQTIHHSGRAILQARAAMVELRDELALRKSEQTGIDGMLAIAFVMIVLLVFFCDLFLTGPGVADRFETMGIPPDLAWFLAVAIAGLILAIELVVGMNIFGAYRRAMVTGRWLSTVIWSLAGAAILFISGLFSFSQYQLTPADSGAREPKELALGLIMALGHFVLIGGGRFLMAAKQEAMRMWTVWSLERKLRAAIESEKKNWRILGDTFHRYLLRLGELSKHVAIPFQMIFFTFERDILKLLAERFEDQIKVFTTAAPNPLQDAGPQLRALDAGKVM